MSEDFRHRGGLFRLGFRVEAKEFDEIFVVFWQLLFQLRPRLGLMHRFLARKEDARGHGKEFLVVLHGIFFFAEDLLGHGVGVVSPDAEIIKPLRHQLGVVGVEKLVKQDGVFGMLEHDRTQHDDARSRIGGQINEVRIAPAQLAFIPGREA